MAIKTSGLLSFQEIQNEFGGAGPISLGEYYRGAGLVPAATAASPSAFTEVPFGTYYNVQIPANGIIQMSQFYGQTAYVAPPPAPNDVLLTNTGDTEEYSYWISPYTGTAYVTLVGSGSAGGTQGSGWGGFADSGGGSGGGGAGQVIYRQPIQVVQGQSYPYKVKPVTYIMGPNPYVDPETGQPMPGEVAYAQPPLTEMFGIVAANGQQGSPGDHFYNGGAGGASGGNSGDGGRGGNSRINTQGLAGFAGLSSTWARGGAGGAAGTGNASQSVAGQQGYGFGAGFGGEAGFKGSDNPDTAGGGGGGGGGFIPPLPGYDANYMAASTGGLWFGAIGCIMIQFGEPPPPPPPPPNTSTFAVANNSGFSAFGSHPDTTATARVAFAADGTWVESGTNATTRSGRWLSGTNGADYELSWSLDPNSIDTPSITGGQPEGTWRTMGTTWAASTNNADSLTDSDVRINVVIREIANPGNSVNLLVTLYADGSCFAVGTLLRTPGGDIAVEELAEGNLVSSFAEPSMIDEDTDGWRDWKISSLDSVRTDTTAMIRKAVRFTRGESVKINGIHSTLTHTCFVFDGKQYGWKLARDVTTSDFFIDSDLNLVPVTSVEFINEPTEFVALNAETLDTLQVKSGDAYILTHNVSA